VVGGGVRRQISRGKPSSLQWGCRRRVPNREWEAVARSGATGTGRREADSRKEGRRASNDASSFCLTFILFKSRDITSFFSRMQSHGLSFSKKKVCSAIRHQQEMLKLFTKI
jgi:hypothetical protein